MRTMKFLYAAVVSLFMGVAANAQSTAKDFFKNDAKVLYLGIDFTNMRLINDSNADARDIRDRQFVGINEVVVNEPKKYKLEKYFHKDAVDTDLGPINKTNEKTDPDDIKSTASSDFNRLTPEDIAKSVKGIDLKNRTGLGVVLVMEAFSQTKKEISCWFTVIDMKTKKVLVAERVTGKQNKFAFTSFRNNWAGAVKDALENIDAKYKDWKTQYSEE
ncbi:hypothetical protein LX64_03635 [Chitinophaga skermanii]|uniref:DUF4410 domain-containing protein n=1 Tax=Chitinophaga skermanii TaxID=331697 RepID=A0A327QF45_9BACT|nr:hypothetical protein [Chitinophaga skermanii]RAJ02615.1 hypothetical protein LX64_03635 [Chitinophaga skermanii]